MVRNQKSKYLILLIIGGLLYNLIEIGFRGWTHWTMFLLGGTCFVFLGLINELIPWRMPLWKQILIGVGIITYLELMTGCVVNLWLGWGIWDYSSMPGNFLGQICPQFMLLWVPVSLIGIILDDWIRYCWYGEARPQYKVF